MIYRLLLSLFLVFNCTFMIAMQQLLADGKKAAAAARESFKDVTGVYEAQIAELTSRITELERKLAQANADKTTLDQFSKDVLDLGTITGATIEPYKAYFDKVGNNKAQAIFDANKESLEIYKQSLTELRAAKHAFYVTYCSEQSKKSFYASHPDARVFLSNLNRHLSRVISIEDMKANTVDYLTAKNICLYPEIFSIKELLEIEKQPSESK